VVNRAVETLFDTPKQEECKLNLHLTGFEAKECETKKELVQHRVVAGPNEVMHQGHRRHMATAYDCMGLHLNGRRTPWRSVVQVYNE